MNNRGYPEQHYRQVADVYWEAFDYTDETTKAVASTWDVPHTTAARWVKEARRRGYLAPRPRRCSCRCPVHCPGAARD